MNNKKIKNVVVQDGVEITTYEDGSQHFRAVDTAQPEEKEANSRSWWQKLADWWNGKKVKPYVTIRDMSDPASKRHEDPFDDGSGSKMLQKLE